MRLEDRPLVEASRQWMLKRNCALTPRQLAMWFAALSLVSAVIAVAFAFQGAWMVVPFAVLEITALGIAFLVYARHAGDYELIKVVSGEVTIEMSSAQRVERSVLSAPWVRVEYRGRPRDLVELKSGRNHYAVGRYVSDQARKVLAQELRLELSGN